MSERPPDQTPSASFLAAVLDNLPDTFCVTDTSGVVRWVSASAERAFAISRDELTGANGLDIFTEESAALLAEGVVQVLAGRGSGLPARLVARRGDGTDLPVDIISTSLIDHPEIRGMLVQIRRVPGELLVDEFTSALATAAPLEEVLAPLVRLAELDLTPSTCAVVTGVPGAAPVTAGAERPLAAALTEPWASIRSRLDAGEDVVLADLSSLPPDLEAIARDAGFAAVWIHQVRVVGVPPATLWVWREVDGPAYAAHRIAVDRLRQRIALALDFDHSHRALARAATTDPLTGAPNRAVFYDAVSAAEGTVDGVGAVLYLDLDGFKLLNDRLGHHVGDGVLVEVSRRLASAVRAGDLHARLGGDEFAAICTSVDTEDQAIALAQRLIDAIGRPMTVEGVDCQVHASVGVALVGPGEVLDERVVVAADEALRRAKADGPGSWRLADR